MAAGSGATLACYGLIVLLWEPLGLTYTIVYMLSGGTTAAIAFAALIVHPQFKAPVPRLKKMILRRRYWLYYALQFMACAAANLCRICRVHDGREVRLCRA